MKTAATVVLVIALISFLHKDHKHDKKAEVFSKPPITYQEGSTGGQPAVLYPEQQPTQPPVQYTGNDERAKQQIIAFAKSAYKSLAISDSTLDEVAGKIVQYATMYGIDYALAAALVARESRFNPNATSPHGAQGLCQLIPSTAQTLGVTSPYDIDQNLNGGFKYFRSLLDRYSDRADQIDLALASYLLGPKAVTPGGLSEKTQGYVNDILAARDQISSK